MSNPYLVLTEYYSVYGISHANGPIKVVEEEIREEWKLMEEGEKIKKKVDLTLESIPSVLSPFFIGIFPILAASFSMGVLFRPFQDNGLEMILLGQIISFTFLGVLGRIRKKNKELKVQPELVKLFEQKPHFMEALEKVYPHTASECKRILGFTAERDAAHKRGDTPCTS